MKIFLRRFETKENGTTGRLILPEKISLATLELPFLDNKKNISCIPLGIYDIHQVLSPKFGRTYEIKNVPNRDSVLFHTGNKLQDSHGCILVGMRHFVSKGEDCIADSRRAFSLLLSVLTSQAYELEIT